MLVCRRAGHAGRSADAGRRPRAAAAAPRWPSRACSRSSGVLSAGQARDWRIAGAGDGHRRPAAHRAAERSTQSTSKWQAGEPGRRSSRYLLDQRRGDGAGPASPASPLVWPEIGLPVPADRARPDALRQASPTLLPHGRRADHRRGRVAEPLAGAGRGRRDLQQPSGDRRRRHDRSTAYDKVHLVPLRRIPALRSRADSVGPATAHTAARRLLRRAGPRTLLHAPGLPPVGPLICYETIFPGEVGRPSRAARAWLLNVTNDAWFGLTPGPHQHFAQARLRAVEEGLPLVRAANDGISAMVDPYGRVLASLPARRGRRARFPAAQAARRRRSYPAYGAGPRPRFLHSAVLIIALSIRKNVSLTIVIKLHYGRLNRGSLCRVADHD